MHKSEIKKEMDVLIDSIKKQADRMNAEQNLSGVELEVFHHKIQKLYEKSILIHHLPTKTEPTPLLFTEKTEESPKPEKQTEILREVPVPVQKTPLVIQETEEKPVTPEAKPVVDLFGNKSAANTKPAPKLKPEKEKVPVVNAASRAANKPIPDLKAAISINDKFRFINELFGGNATEYHIALNQINTCSGFEEADIYVSNIKDIYKWEEDHEVVTFFLELVERRFLQV
jgi:hypothetical protein